MNENMSNQTGNPETGAKPAETEQPSFIPTEIPVNQFEQPPVQQPFAAQSQTEGQQSGFQNFVVGARVTAEPSQTGGQQSGFQPDLLPKKPEYTGKEIVFAIAAVIISFFYVRFALFKMNGFVTTFTYAAIFTAVIVYFKAKGKRFTPFCKGFAAVIYLFSTVFSITDNMLVKMLDLVFLFAAGGYFIYAVSREKNGIDRFLPLALLKSDFEYPFSKFDVLFRITGDCASNKFSGRVKLILLGLVLAFPVTAVVALLLTSADEGMNKMLGDVFRAIFSENIWILILQLVIAVPITAYIFGMIYTGSYPEGSTPPNEEKCESILSSARCIHNIILYSAVTPICMLYIMFFISQANYFLSAFMNDLPRGYSYADYARKGFFELVTVALINMAVIIFINVFSKNSGRNKPVLLKFYSATLCVFTMILIATAVSKMVMYISYFGLTRLRVYTTWFMILCAAIFVLMIIKQFKFEFNIAKWALGVFIVMFALLCFSRPDALIAKYNIEMYNSGALEELDTDELRDMSDDALLVALDSGALNESEVRLSRRRNKSGSNISSLIVNNRID